MKRAITLLASLTLVAGLMTGCGQKPAEPSPSIDVSPTPPVVSDNLNSSKETLEKLSALLGKQDADVTAAMGEGTAITPEGSADIISREYETDLFGETLVAAINFADDKTVAYINVALSDKELDAYKQELETAFGAPQEADDDANLDEGNGMQSFTWNTSGAQITLKRAYDVNTLEITPIP